MNPVHGITLSTEVQSQRMARCSEFFLFFADSPKVRSMVCSNQNAINQRYGFISARAKDEEYASHRTRTMV
jgi:hypothetical protein